MGPSFGSPKQERGRTSTPSIRVFWGFVFGIKTKAQLVRIILFLITNLLLFSRLHSTSAKISATARKSV